MQIWPLIIMRVPDGTGFSALYNYSSFVALHYFIRIESIYLKAVQNLFFFVHILERTVEFRATKKLALFTLYSTH